MAQMDFGFSPAAPPGVSWQRFPAVVRADYALLVDGRRTDFWVRTCGHPTANRPYYVVSPTGRIMARKFSRLEDAQAAAIAWHAQEPQTRTGRQWLVDHNLPVVEGDPINDMEVRGP